MGKCVTAFGRPLKRAVSGTFARDPDADGARVFEDVGLRHFHRDPGRKRIGQDELGDRFRPVFHEVDVAAGARLFLDKEDGVRVGDKCPRTTDRFAIPGDRFDFDGETDRLTPALFTVENADFRR